MQKNTWLLVLLGSGAIACGGTATQDAVATPEVSRGPSVGTPGTGGALGSGMRAGSSAPAGGSGGTGRKPSGAAGVAGVAGAVMHDDDGGGSGGAGARGGAGGMRSEGMTGAPSCESSAPNQFEPNPDVGPGGARYEDSPHFRVYGDASEDAVAATLNHLESAYSCFVETLCFRSAGLSVNSEDGPYYKLNVYGVRSLANAAGVMQSDLRAGLAYLEVVNDSLPDPRVTVHEFGHSLAFTEHEWVDQLRTGAWWETMANWVADSYLTSSLCEQARSRFGVEPGRSIINLPKVIGESYRLIVSDQNLYEAWPFLTYLTNNPDDYPGLGSTTVRELMRNHPGNNDTPLHVLERVAAPVRVQTILGRYWARMAYLDIGHPLAQQAFEDQRGELDFANVEPAGDDTYRVRPNRRPMYGGANIIPLEGSGEVTIDVTNLGNGLPESNFTATLAIRANDGTVRYLDLPDGSGRATIESSEDASLVVVNTPDTLYQYDAFQTESSSPQATGLDYQVQITGLRPAD